MQKISVIIPSKNRFDYTAQAIRSIYDQDVPAKYSIQIIVVDDQSSPEIESVLGKMFPEVLFIKNNTKNHGPGPSRNVGMKKIEGDYVAFLDNDDQWKKDFLKNSLNSLNNSDAVASLCLTDEFFDGKFDFFYKIKIKFLNLARYFVLIFYSILRYRRLPKSGFYLGQLSHMLFKNNVLKIRFREDLYAGEDMEFIAKSTLEKDLIIIPKKLVRFRYEPKSNTQSLAVVKNKWNSYEKVIRDLPDSHKEGILFVLFLKYIRMFQ